MANTVKGAGSIMGDDGKGRNPVQKSILRHNLKVIDKKKEVAEKMHKIPKKPVRYLTQAEQKEKTKHWPKAHPEPTAKEKTDYQKRTGRGYNE